MFEEETAWKYTKARGEIKEPVKVSSYDGTIAKGRAQTAPTTRVKIEEDKVAAKGSYNTAITEAMGTVSGQQGDSLQMEGQDDSCAGDTRFELAPSTTEHQDDRKWLHVSEL